MKNLKLEVPIEDWFTFQGKALNLGVEWQSGRELISVNFGSPYIAIIDNVMYRVFSKDTFNDFNIGECTLQEFLLIGNNRKRCVHRKVRVIDHGQIPLVTEKVKISYDELWSKLKCKLIESKI